MKKENHIVAKVALGTYLFVLGIGIVLNEMGENTRLHNRAIQETINTAEDMIEWISYDVENGKTNDTIGETYITNLNEIIIDLETTR